MEKMEQFIHKCDRWLLPALVILFVLQMATLPFMVNYTYADRATPPEHQLTYTAGRLRWDNNTHINANGVAELKLFDAEYDGVKSDDGKDIIAPGTKGESSVRLVNGAPGPVNYTAVLYSIKSSDRLPVTAELARVEGSVPTGKYLLPPGVQQEQVLEAITGKVGGRRNVDFDISWNWNYYESEKQDIIDTALGNAAEDNITVGLYIVVEDNNDYSLPKTADESHFGAYLIMMCTSGVLLVLLFLEKRKEQECES